MSDPGAEHRGPGARRFAHVDGIQTSYFEAGSGETMLLIHGGHFGMHISSAIAWTPIIPMLSDRFHVLAVDKLGMGFTEKPLHDADYTMAAVVDHLGCFLDRMGVRQVHLVGQSRGALPAARLALDRPGMVKSLTIFNSNSLAPGDPAAKVADVPAIFLPDGPPINGATIRRMVMNGYSAHAQIAPETIDQMVRAHLEVALLPQSRQVALQFERLRASFVADHTELVQARPGLARNSGSGWWMASTKDETLQMIQEGQLKTPTQLIWGAADRGAMADLGLAIFHLLAPLGMRVRFHLFNRCGHHPFAERAREVTRLMVGFIDSLAPVGD
jgi:pimeloyl-ACP methyl ester carboxylesterase